MERAMSELQSKDTKGAKDVLLMLDMNETIDQMAMANSVRWYGHVLRREGGHVMRKEGGHVLRMVLDFEVKGQRKKSRPKKTQKQVKDKT